MHETNISVKYYSSTNDEQDMVNSVMEPTASEIIKRARRKTLLNQTVFASKLGKTQGTLSKYESGDVHPPSEVIMHCMNILNTDPTSDSVDDLVDKIRQLNGDQYSKVRKALHVLLEGYLSHH